MRDSKNQQLSPGEVLGIVTRFDNLYEAGAGVTWEFARGWSLSPEVLFVRDQSNVLVVNYSSTEMWITLTSSSARGRAPRRSAGHG